MTRTARTGLLFHLLLAASVTTGCSSLSREQGTPSHFEVEVRSASQQAMDPELHERSDMLFNYVAGNLSYSNGAYDDALEYLKAVSEEVTSPVEKLHWTLSELYMMQDRREEARVEVEKAIAVNPNNSRYRFMLATLLTWAGDFVAAEEQYKAMLEASEDLIQGAFFYYADFLQQRGRREEAIDLVVTHLNDAEDIGMALWVLGDLYEASKNFKKAQEIYEDGVRRGGLSEKLFNSLGRIYLMNNDVEAARKLCEQMVEQDPFHFRANLLLAQLLVAENRLDEAVEQFQRLLDDTTALEGYDYSEVRKVRLELAAAEAARENFSGAERQFLLLLQEEPKNYSVQYELATVYVRMGRNIKAFEILEEIPKDAELYAHARYLLAFILKEDGNPVRAVKELQDLVVSHPNLAVIWSRLVICLSELEREEEALEVVGKGLAMHPQNEGLLFEYARLLEKMGRHEEAIATMEEVLILNPKNSYALNYIAYALAEMGIELERAEGLINRALELRPQDGYFADTLGWIHYKRGNYKEAKQHIERAVGLTEGDIVILEHLGDVLLALGEREKAYETYNEALKGQTENLSRDEKDAVERMEKKKQENS
ncbi:MAG: tetratricopeptide repeat protein [Bdellovibrionota bacterium]